MPLLTVVAGPNGSGKSTLTSSVSLAGVDILINPDAIARRLNPEQPARAAIAAAREAILLCRAALSAKHTFVLETTLAGHCAMAVMRDARAAGYRTAIVYVALGNPDLHMERVRLRVSRGGHDIPDGDIRRRYARSLHRAPDAISLADEGSCSRQFRSLPSPKAGDSVTGS